MNDSFGNPVYIFNPYSYEELLQLIGPPGIIDKYLLCLSELHEGTRVEQCPKPTITAIDEQGASAISVIERCKSNYQQRQWDVGSFMLYDEEENYKALRTVASLPSFDPADRVGTCLLQAHKNKESHLGCMSDYLKFAYEISDSAKFWL